jgi:GGDEF domain-containing protein
VAEVLRSDLRKQDVAARYGGEEFVLLMPETDVDGARAVAERYRRKIADASLADSVRTESIRVGPARDTTAFGDTRITIVDGSRWSIEAPPPSRDIRVTASFGVATFPEHDARSVDDLLQTADRALYRAKASGRNCVVVADGVPRVADAADR